MSAAEAYTLAHTARCKLQMAADYPDRNLRFILGHAFTLDKLRLRIAEIEMDMEDENDLVDELSEPLDAPKPESRVSFKHNSARPSSTNRARSPPPADPSDGSDGEEEEEDDDDMEIDDEDDEGLSLQRFESGSARQPQMIDDKGEEEEEEELKTPPMPSEDELRTITGGEGDEGLAEAYKRVAGCPCHGQKGPHASHVWELPQQPGEQEMQHGVRYAVVAVDA